MPATPAEEDVKEELNFRHYPGTTPGVVLRENRDHNCNLFCQVPSLSLQLPPPINNAEGKTLSQQFRANFEGHDVKFYLDDPSRIFSSFTMLTPTFFAAAYDARHNPASEIVIGAFQLSEGGPSLKKESCKIDANEQGVVGPFVDGPAELTYLFGKSGNGSFIYVISKPLLAGRLTSPTAPNIATVTMNSILVKYYTLTSSRDLITLGHHAGNNHILNIIKPRFRSEGEWEVNVQNINLEGVTPNKMLYRSIDKSLLLISPQGMTILHGI